MKRVFSYEKWACDTDILFHNSTEEYKESRHELMRELDGEVVDFERTLPTTWVRDPRGLLTYIHIDWTDPVATTPFRLDALMVAGGALAVYGLAMLCQNLKDLLCSML